MIGVMSGCQRLWPVCGCSRRRLERSISMVFRAWPPHASIRLFAPRTGTRANKGHTAGAMAIRSPDKKPAQKPARRSSVVYVEGDDAAISVARAVLAQRNLALAVAADMEQACSLARRKPPEVILVNLDLAALGTARLIHLLRENPATQAAPVLAVGKDAAPEAAIKALEAGFFQYLVAPLDAGQLTEALDYALEFSALERTEL